MLIRRLSRHQQGFHVFGTCIFMILKLSQVFTGHLECLALINRNLLLFDHIRSSQYVNNLVKRLSFYFSGSITASHTNPNIN